jgi:hypothetical protein
MPPEFVSSTTKLLVHFKTDDTIFEKGFAAAYMQIGADMLPPTYSGGYGGSRTTHESKVRRKSTPAKKHHQQQHQQLIRTPPAKLT